MNNLGCAKAKRVVLQRHFKYCKISESEKCNFLNKCAYKNHEPLINKDHEQINDKVIILEKIVNALLQKVLSLETGQNLI